MPPISMYEYTGAYCEQLFIARRLGICPTNLLYLQVSIWPLAFFSRPLYTLNNSTY